MLAKIEKEGYAEAAKKYEPLLEESEKQKELALQREKEERQQKELALAKEKEALAKEKETRILSATTLLEYNVPIEKIMQTTGLSREEIEEIRKKIA
jgi:hypothetical protein